MSINEYDDDDDDDDDDDLIGRSHVNIVKRSTSLIIKYVGINVDRTA